MAGNHVTHHKHWFTRVGMLLLLFELFKPLIKWSGLHVWHVIDWLWQLLELPILYIGSLWVMMLILRVIFWIFGVRDNTSTNGDDWDDGYDNGWLDSWSMHQNRDDHWHDVY